MIGYTFHRNEQENAMIWSIRSLGRGLTTITLLILISACGPSSTERLQDAVQRGTQAYQAGDVAEFLRQSQILVRLAPENYRHRYNLACAYALNGDKDNTVATLKFLLDEDYELALLAGTDTDFDAYRDSPEFQTLAAIIAEKTQPLNNSRIAFSLPERDLIPEGMAYDPVEEAFYIGSLQKCKIIRVDKNQRITDFTAERQDGMLRVLGMRVDTERRILWVASAYGFIRPDIPEELLGSTGVFKFNLQTGELIKKYMLPQEEGHYLNDLTIHPNGDVYITDWRIYGVYKISAETDVLEKFIDMPRQPNGIDLSDDGGRLFIAGDGMSVVDLATGEFRELAYPVNMFVSGDGCYFYKNSLIAVQNNKVTRFHLNDAQDEIIRAEMLEAYHPLFNLPTTGALAGDDFYFIANSQLLSYDADGYLFPMNELEETKILHVTLR